MDETLPVKQPTSAPVTGLQQEGKNNINVNNQSGGTVNINYNIYGQTSIDSSAEMMIAIQSFSKKYYQLIVTCEESVFRDGVITVSADRALTKYNVPPEIFERCSTLSEEGIDELKHFPAIICQENTEMRGITSPMQFCMYCYIQKIMKVGKNVKVAFKPIAPIQQVKLCDKRNAMFFDLNMDCAITDLNRSAWSIHKVNLFAAFKEAEIPRMPMPM